MVLVVLELAVAVAVAVLSMPHLYPLHLAALFLTTSVLAVVEVVKAEVLVVVTLNLVL